MNLLFKISGEFFSASNDLTNDGVLFFNTLKESEITSGYMVVGGGNRIRGGQIDVSSSRNSPALTRNTSDKLGVLSTLFNSFLLSEFLNFMGFKSVVLTHFSDFGVKYSPEVAISYFDQGYWVIFGGGLGSVGYVSTDLSSVIKSLEVGVDAMVKVTKVDGVYDMDPSLNDSKILNKVSYSHIIEKKLSVLDLSSVSIASENQLPIGVCSVKNFKSFLKKEDGSVGSIIGYDWR
ncbi:hypothetical protein [Alphaproteobacteria bacterium endosymbiont of Tiliacea citrago]|uniref:amino acid kinase family protein n=1 Tax=Alphaproteobacteria bacterium endosymbiont of Tiliacea citrago TaxID=3077944 RepID=UPI00313C6EB8